MIMMGFSYKKQCQTVREKICTGYQECHYQPREKCVDLPEEQCEDTPREVCHHTPDTICQGGQGTRSTIFSICIFMILKFKSKTYIAAGEY